MLRQPVAKRGRPARDGPDVQPPKTGIGVVRDLHAGEGGTVAVPHATGEIYHRRVQLVSKHKHFFLVLFSRCALHTLMRDVGGRCCALIALRPLDRVLIGIGKEVFASRSSERDG